MKSDKTNFPLLSALSIKSVSQCSVPSHIIFFKPSIASGLDLDRVGMAMMSKAEREKYLGKKEADAKKVIKGFSINWDNLGFDKLEAVGEPSGKARKPLEK